MKSKNFEDLMVITTVQVEFLYALRNGWINWRNFSDGIGNTIYDDFVESIIDKLSLIFESFVPIFMIMKPNKFETNFNKKEEALKFEKEFTKYTQVFKDSQVIPASDNDPETGKKVYIVRFTF